MTATLPQPSACPTCGRPLTRPYCEHTRTVIAALEAEDAPHFDVFAEDVRLFVDRLLDEVDAIVNRPRRRQCPSAVRNIVRRADI